MPTLSRLVLNLRSRQVRAELANPYQLHRTLLQTFDSTRKQAGLLYRVETERGSPPILLAQSLAPPDWNVLPEDYLLQCADNPALREFEPRFAAGQRLRFRLLANPTHRRNGKRVGCMSESEQRSWLERKALAGGFRVLACNIATQDRRSPVKRDERGRVTMPLVAVRYDGLLEALDPEALKVAVLEGIGTAKAFGFGLLSLAR